MEGDQRWVPDDLEVWLPCTLKSQDDQVAKFSSSERSLTVPIAKFASLERVTEEQLAGIDDICALPTISEGAMLHTVRVRYLQQLVYTRVARVLVAVNPYCALPIFNAEYLDRYRGVPDTMRLPPHIYGLSQDALRGLRDDSSNCSHVVLIGGESGAGKTESAKLFLAFVTEAAQGGDETLKERILRTSPVFESFGNAMTVRNNNSSRFGKWLGLHFGKSLEIQNCSFTKYLLETTRVIAHGKKERSYHVFYQLLRGRNRFPALKLGDVRDYHYLKGGQHTAPGVDDSQNFEDTLEAFELLGFSATEQSDILAIVAGILTLGNCEIQAASEGDGSKLASDGPADRAAELLGVCSEDLKHCMLFKRIQVGGSLIETKLSIEKASSVRDTIAQMVYGCLFDWLVKRMNQTLSRDSNDNAVQPHQRSLGVLDIAGFESFETNSLEQLLINLANEHLQRSFGTTIVKAELDSYAEEGVAVDVAFTDNSAVLELIDGKDGILDRLDDEANMPKGSDSGYASKLVKELAGRQRFAVPKFGGRPEFGIQHFAGLVTYTCVGFLDKNSMQLPEAAPTLLGNSTMGLVREISDMCNAESAEAAKRQNEFIKKRPKTRSASIGFRESLRALTVKIGEADRHYIRCIKPNPDKIAGNFQSKMVMEQLHFSGIVEAVCVRHQGFGLRLPFGEFAEHYRCIVELLEPRCKKVAKGDVKAVVEHLPVVLKGAIGPGSIMLGKTKVFVKTAAITELDRGRERALAQFATRLQARCRGLLARRRVQVLKVHSRRLQDWMVLVQAFDPATKVAAVPQGCISLQFPSMEAAKVAQTQLVALLEHAATLGWQNHLVAVAQQLLRRLEQELGARKALAGLQSSLDIMAIERELARAEGLGLPKDAMLEERFARLQVQLPLLRKMESALATVGKPGEDVGDELTSVVNAVKDAGLLTGPEAWLAGTGGSELMERLVARHKQQEEHCKNEAERKAKEAERKAREAELQKKLAEQRESEEKRICSGLRKAGDEFDCDTLEELLGEAANLGLGGAAWQSTVDESHRVFHDLQRESFVFRALSQVQEEAQQPDPPEVTFSRLKHLSDQVRRLKADEELSREARQAVATAAGRRNSTAPASAFEDLSGFAGLKPAGLWRGHRRTLQSSELGRATIPCMTPEQMLSHSKVTISEALTRVPADRELRAIQNFRDVVTWMGDRQAADCQRQASRSAVLGLARGDASLRDEVYVQMLKQLTDNPSSRSQLRGWELFEQLCLMVPPSQNMMEYVRAQVQAISAGEGAAVECARRCLTALQAFEELGTLRGHLWKKSPNRLRMSSYDKRFFAVRDMHILWWSKADHAGKPEAANPDGGPLCKGSINLVANDCTVEPLDGNSTSFTLHNNGLPWDLDRLVKVGGARGDRVYEFDTTDSEHLREVWLDVIQAHIARGRQMRGTAEAKGNIVMPVPETAAALPKRVTFASMNTVTGQNWCGKVGDTVWFKGLCGGLPDGSELVYGSKGTVTRLEPDMVAVHFQGLSFNLRCARSDISETEPPAELCGGWHVHEMAWYTGESNMLPDKTSVKYGAPGRIVGPCNDAAIEEGNCLAVLFQTVREAVVIPVAELSRTEPPTTFAGDWQLGDTAFYRGADQTLDGGKVPYGAQGEVVGPDPKSEKGVAVQFSEIHRPVYCLTTTLSKRQPSPR